MSTWTALVGTVGVAVLALVAFVYLFMVGVRALADERDAIVQPEDVVERLGALTPGQVFTDTAQRRAEQKRRLRLVSETSRGPAKLSTFTPKGAA